MMIIWRCTHSTNTVSTRKTDRGLLRTSSMYVALARQLLGPLSHCRPPVSCVLSALASQLVERCSSLRNCQFGEESLFLVLLVFPQHSTNSLLDLCRAPHPIDRQLLAACIAHTRWPYLSFKLDRSVIGVCASGYILGPAVLRSGRDKVIMSHHVHSARAGGNCCWNCLQSSQFRWVHIIPCMLCSHAKLRRYTMYARLSVARLKLSTVNQY